MLAPDGYLVEDDLVHVGPDRVVRVAYVADVPGKVSMGWLRELYAGDVDVTIGISPLPNHQVIKDLTEMIQALDAQLYLDAEKGDHREQSPKVRTRNGLWQLRDDIQTGGNRMYQTTILAAVAAPDRESLQKRYATLEERLAGSGVTIRSAYLGQGAAFRGGRLPGPLRHSHPGGGVRPRLRQGESIAGLLPGHGTGRRAKRRTRTNQVNRIKAFR